MTTSAGARGPALDVKPVERARRASWTSALECRSDTRLRRLGPTSRYALAPQMHKLLASGTPFATRSQVRLHRCCPRSESTASSDIRHSYNACPPESIHHPGIGPPAGRTRRGTSRRPEIRSRPQARWSNSHSRSGTSETTYRHDRREGLRPYLISTKRC